MQDFDLLDVMDTASSRIQILMAEDGLNQVELAEKVKKSKGLISSYLKPETKPSDIFLRQLEDNLGWSARWIRTGQGPSRVSRKQPYISAENSNNTPLATEGAQSYIPSDKLLRLLELRQAMGFDDKQMAERLDMDEFEYVSIETGKIPIGRRLSRIIIDAFDLFDVWWETGQGNMYRPTGDIELEMVDEEEYEGVWLPFFPIPIEGGFNEMSDPEANYGSAEKIKVLIRRGENVDRNVVFTVRGQSMYPKYSEGTKIRCKKINESDWEYITSGVYAFSYNESFVVKRIKNNDLLEKGYLVLHSDNPDFGSTPVPIDQIHHIWKILRIIDSPAD